jgi:kynurenine formamidase
VQSLDGARSRHLVDLSHPLHPGIPFYPGKGAAPFAHEWTSRFAAEGANVGRIGLGEHQGTHLDAPLHFIDGGLSVDALEPDRFIADAVVIDVTDRVAGDPEYCLQPEDVDVWEREHGPVERGTWVLLATGWAARWDEAGAYVNIDDRGIPRYPACSVAAGRALASKGIGGIGVESLSVDNARTSADVRSPTHKVLLGAGCLIVENLRDLHRLPTVGATLWIAPLPVVGGSGAPARVFAMIEG